MLLGNVSLTVTDEGWGLVWRKPEVRPQDIRKWEKKIPYSFENTFPSVDHVDLVSVSVRSCHYGASQVLINCIGL